MKVVAPTQARVSAPEKGLPPAKLSELPVSDKCILWQGQGSLSLFESGQDLFQDRSELLGVGFH